MKHRNPERWHAIENKLNTEQTIWLATTRKDRRPHLVPLWFVWHNNMIYICTTPGTQKYTNMVHNQMVSLAFPDTTDVLIIEGEAHVADEKTVDILGEQFYHKYEWDFRYDETARWRLIEITPHKILAWGDGFDETDGIRVL